MICTFYSYKGGVGRSMALANVADILSRRGLKVLMIDFDLEAPGLEQFFYRGDEREQRDAVRRQSGLLDLLLAYKDTMSVSKSGGDFRDIGRYIASIFPRRPQGGRLDLMPAGQRLTSEQLNRYALALRSFDWQDFYFNWEGDLFFEWLRRSLVPEPYDLVLIDSRTGVTEMGGICGYQLADVIVMMCGANHQNVDGTWSMLEDFRSQPVEGLRRGRGLEIVVVPARVEQRAPALLAEFYERFERRFGALLPARLADAGITFRDLTIPYDPQFAFEERVARNPAEQAAKEHLASIFSNLADVITALAPGETRLGSSLGQMADSALSRLGGSPEGGEDAPPKEGTTQARYDETKRFADFDVLLSYSRPDAALVTELRSALAREGVRAETDAAGGAVGSDWKLRMEDMLSHTRALAVCLGSGSFEAQQQKLVTLALMARDAGRDVALLPVLLPGHPAAEPADRALAEFLTFDLRGGLDRETLAGLVATLRRPAARPPGGRTAAAPPVESEERCPYIGAGAFAEHHSDLFFGRAEEIRELLARVRADPLVLLVGPSASGKTSLVRAGLFPALRKAQPEWKLIDAASPDKVAQAVARAIPPGSSPPPEGDPLAVLARRPRGSVLVAIDTLPAATESGRGAIEAVVGTLLKHGARVLVSVRSDRIDAWEPCMGGTALAKCSRMQLGAPGPGALREIAERPADRAGLAFEPGLVDRLMSRSENEPGVLPFLQRTLVCLWDSRRSGWLTNAAYDGFGGLRGIVVDCAEQHFASQPADASEAMRRILLRLLQIAPGGTRATGQRVRNATLAAPGSAAVRIVEELVQARLLVATRERGEAAVELAHEALARDWPRALVWLEQQRGFLEWLHRLQAESDAWLASGRSDGSLLHGAALDEAERQCLQFGNDVGPDIQDFVATSARQRDELKARRLRVRSLLTGVFMCVALAAAGGWFSSVRRGTDLRMQAMELSDQRDALLDQLKQLEGERNIAETQRTETESRLTELKSALDGALAAMRDGGGKATDPAVAAPIERLVEQAQVAVEQQQRLARYTRKRAVEIDRQQTVLRDILVRSAKALPEK